jgi:transposase
MVAYTKAAVERAMQVQEVILRAMAKRITWWQAAEIIGVSDRSMRRWRERYEQHGYDGLMDRRRGAPSGRRVPLATVEQVLGLYRERYFDLNVRHFHEKLAEEHGVHLSYTWVKQALQGAGLVARGCKRGAHRKRRPRRPLPGARRAVRNRLPAACGAGPRPHLFAAPRAGGQPRQHRAV